MTNAQVFLMGGLFASVVWIVATWWRDARRMEADMKTAEAWARRQTAGRRWRAYVLQCGFSAMDQVAIERQRGEWARWGERWASPYYFPDGARVPRKVHLLTEPESVYAEQQREDERDLLRALAREIESRSTLNTPGKL